MEREDFLRNKAVEYSEVDKNFLEFDVCGYTINDKELIIKAYLEGAKCADEHPNKDLVYTKQELYDMGFAFDLNGVICKMSDYYDIMAVAPNKLRKKKWIEKACEHLKGLSYQEYPGGPIVRVMTDDMIEGFVKSMES